jgi:starch synthase
VLGNASSVLTIHNIVYQGKYNRSDYDYLGLGWANFTPDKFEDFGEINFLKSGIHYADLVTTVSPTHAEETRGAIGGSGLGPILSAQGNQYWGILNGVDYEYWDPSKDPLIPARYSRENVSGKAVCKRELQRRLMLHENPTIPLIGIIGRFVEQKGFSPACPID